MNEKKDNELILSEEENFLLSTKISNNIENEFQKNKTIKINKNSKKKNSQKKQTNFNSNKNSIKKIKTVFNKRQSNINKSKKKKENMKKNQKNKKNMKKNKKKSNIIETESEEVDLSDKSSVSETEIRKSDKKYSKKFLEMENKFQERISFLENKVLGLMKNTNNNQKKNKINDDEKILLMNNIKLLTTKQLRTMSGFLKDNLKFSKSKEKEINIDLNLLSQNKFHKLKEHIDNALTNQKDELIKSLDNHNKMKKINEDKIDLELNDAEFVRQNLKSSDIQTFTNKNFYSEEKKMKKNENEFLNKKRKNCILENTFDLSESSCKNIY